MENIRRSKEGEKITWRGCFRRRWLAAVKTVAGPGGATSSLLCFPLYFLFVFFFYSSLLLSFFFFLSVFSCSLSLFLCFFFYSSVSLPLSFFCSFSLLFFFLSRVPLLYLCIYRQRRAMKMPCLCPVRGQGRVDGRQLGACPIYSFIHDRSPVSIQGSGVFGSASF